jgi:hypothetical protein
VISVLVFVNVELGREVLYIVEVLVARIGNGNSIEEDSAFESICDGVLREALVGLHWFVGLG